MSETLILLDAAGRRRSPATTPGFLAGRAPRNKGMEYPPDPPHVEEILVVMRQAGHDRHGLRVRALIAVVWRAGLRISEALALSETDIDPSRGSVLVRHGKGDRRREAGMDPFGFAQLAAWQAHRVMLPPGPLFCVIDGPTRGRRWSANRRPRRTARPGRRGRRTAALRPPPSAAPRARRRASPRRGRGQHHPAPARHTDLGTTSTYLQGIDPSEIINTVRSRRAPMISMTAGPDL